MLLLPWLFLLNVAATAEIPELSPKCAEMSGDFSLQFHGQIWPFSRRKFDLRLTFLDGASGVTITTNYHPRLLTQTLDTDTLLNTSRYEWSLGGLNVHDCYNQPYRCLRSAAQSLSDLSVARLYHVEDWTPESKRALYCAIERVRLFAKTIRTEVLQPTLRALPGF